MRFHTTFLLLIATALLHAVRAEIRLDDPTPNGWYSAYSNYPEYCSTPAMMTQRTIPPLKPDSRLGETRLVHVTATIRHGARTPTDGGYHCWEGYWENPATGVWDCDLKWDMAPPTPRHEKEQEGMDGSGYSNTPVFFEKHYDAMMDPKNDLSNNLFGTCQTGQLLLQGYEQHTVNGQILRDAYAFDSAKYDHDIQMRLIDLETPQPWDQLYLRSDDDSRVLISGQVLVRSLLEPELEAAPQPVRIPVHLSDRDRDQVAVNERTCPRLTEMRENFQKTAIFKAYNSSKEAKAIRTFMKDDLKAGDMEIDILSCLMPTICTDKPLPAAFDYGNSDMFERMYKFEYKRYNMHLLANEGEYSKLAMAPLWSEIMDKIGPIIRGEARGKPANRLHVVSGHDDTIAPLMASLGIWNDTDWPPYASMFLIEIHEIIDGQTDRRFYSSKFAFRLLYDGKVITNQLEGCLNEADLCDIKVLTNLVEGFATRERDCQKQRKGFFLWSGSGGSILSGPVKSFLLVVVGALLGGMIMSFYITGSIWGGGSSSKRGAGGYDRGASTFTESDMSMPTGSYRDDPGPTSYQDGSPDKPKGEASFLD